MSKAKLAANFVKRKITWLSENGDRSRAALAKMRRGVAKHPGSAPELWDVVLDGIPEELLGDGNPTEGEWAVHTALTLFAAHQQGKSLPEQCMHKEGESLGKATRKLAQNEDEEARVRRRFNIVATSGGIEEFSYHLRGLVQLMKAKSIHLDYAALTEDLYWYQFPDSRDSIRLRWGQDYYFRKDDSEDEEE